MQKIVLFLLFAGLLFLPHLAWAGDSRGRNGFSLSLDGFSTAGFRSDRYSVYFDTAVENIGNAGVGARVGIEGVQKDGFGVKFLAGYQRVFYSNIGIDQINKNYFTTDLLFTWHVPKKVNKWDWHVMAGPNFLVSSTDTQGYLTSGGGACYYFGDHWSVKVEPSVVTDFSGVWGKLAAGVDYHF